MACMKPCQTGALLLVTLSAFISVLLLNTQPSNALIPKECAHNISKPLGVCCPKNYHNGMVCGGPKFGHCERIVTPKEQVPKVFHIDDRSGWPTRFFTFACQCYGNFFGVGCDECWFGWSGKNCDVKTHLVRKDIRKLSPFELKVFIDVFKKSQTWPSGYVILEEKDTWHSDPLFKPKILDASIQYFITFLHRYTSRTTMFKDQEDCDKYGILNFSHDGVTFPTWHRYFLLVWERMLSRIAHKVHGVTKFAMPYWDSIGLKSCDICTNEYIGGPGKRDRDGLRIHEAHPFHNLTDFCHEPVRDQPCFGCHSANRIGKLTRDWNSFEFPDQEDWAFAMSRKHYFVAGERDRPGCEAFHMALEGFCGRPGTDGSMLWTHNKVHNMIDGSMCCAGTATNDPIFALHHTLADKAYTLWFSKNKPKLSEYPNKGVRPGHCRDCFMTGFMPPVRNSDMFVDSNSFGYSYDDRSLATYAQNGQPPLHY